jgi:hypothetical protein
MAEKVAQQDADVVVRRLHTLVTCGPWDLDIAQAMSAYGYDAVKWAEGQGVLAELVSCDLPDKDCLATAIGWYNEAMRTAREALVSAPWLLAKLGVVEVVTG